MDIKDKIVSGRTFLGIELGSTRIKAVLIDDDYQPVSSGSFDWENRFENGYWTYSLDDIHTGIQSCYASLAADVMEKYGANIETIGAMGISGMMHGLLAFDENDKLLTPFRTWRNTTTEKAAEELTELFDFNIPQRWSVAHFYQSVLDNEDYVPKTSYITTLAGYVHFLLTGEHIVGIGEASGMFPITNGSYDKKMAESLAAACKNHGINIHFDTLFPKFLTAGETAGVLTKNGAAFLDKSGHLKAGVPIAAPEGDAGTGMIATNAVRTATGNVSAGTSVFAMLVLEKPLQRLHREIDIVTTPDGAPVAMVHCNNCCSELDVWVKMFGEFAALIGNKLDKSDLYNLLYVNAMSGKKDCGGVVSYNFLSDEPVADTHNARPAYIRTPDSKMTLADFFRSELYAAMAMLKIGMDILFKDERVTAKQFTGHGGLFKVKNAAQQILADALSTDVEVMETAGEGGAWGMALLAAYMKKSDNKSLADWLDSEVFADMSKDKYKPEQEGIDGFNEYLKNYKANLDILYK